ncbi:hypothetical protein [Massilia sp. LC238]|jgi:hypothetical protein|uniref:hypothetical protein n=1 Tax=Massilia sp. LC238 TaxID=1502852 RepID=UPI0004E310D1|nr:hypothetical protein [Massilia sp. LC238]KFC72702.1 hypothetical protein FG94_01879 [Massilia sp. LC238]
MKLSASKIKEMTGCKTRALGESALYSRLETQHWFRGDRVYRPAGFDRRKNLVHFTSTWAVEGGGVGHSRVGMPLKLALECAGDLAQAVVLH